MIGVISDFAANLRCSYWEFQFLELADCHAYDFALGRSVLLQPQRQQQRICEAGQEGFHGFGICRAGVRRRSVIFFKNKRIAHRGSHWYEVNFLMRAEL